MRNEIINIAGIGFEDLGVLQQRLQKDAKCFASQSDEVLYFDKNEDNWISCRQHELSDFQETNTGWADFLEKYPLEFVKVEKAEDTLGNFFGDSTLPTGISTIKESIDHIAAQENVSFNSIAVDSPLDGYTGPIADIKLPYGWDSFGEMPIGLGQVKKEDIPDIFKSIKKPKDEAQIWKDRYYSLLGVLNQFSKDS